jgi:mannonate dehydratase
LQQIIPVADDCDGKMVIHPDDLLFSTLGLPRVLSTANDLQYLVDFVPSLNNGL